MMGAARPLRVLMVDDSPDDADLTIREVRRGGFDVVWERVQTAAGLRERLGRGRWDLVVSDWMMPSFTAPDALALVQELSPGTPFFIVSGTVGEETAVTALKAGADDFMLKGRLWRLVPAIRRAMREAAARRRRDGPGRLARSVVRDLDDLLGDIVARVGLLRRSGSAALAAGLGDIETAAERARALVGRLRDAGSRRNGRCVAGGGRGGG